MSTIHFDACPVCHKDSLESVNAVVDHSVSGETFQIVECPQCKLRLTQDQPDESAIGPYYASEDYISHSDSSQGLINKLYHRVRKHMLRRKRAAVERYQPSGRLLDIGAGTGYFMAHMRDYDWAVEGLEPDAGARSLAASQFGLEIHDTDHLFSYAPARFDAITMWHVLEHVHSLQRYMQTLYEILNHDGILVIAVPNYTSLDAGFYKAAWAAFDVPRHLWHFAPETMRQLLAQHGFQLIDLKGMPFDPYYVSMLSEKYKKTPLGIVRATAIGTLSNVKALFNHERSSSVIYFARKSKT